MKQIITCSLVLLWSASAWAVTNVVDLGIFNVPAGSNKFEIRIKPTQTVSGTISSMVFTVRFLSSYNVTLDPEAFAPFNFALFPAGMHPSGTQGGYDYYSFAATLNLNVTWTSGVEVVVAKLYHSNNGSGQGTFELIEDSWTNNNQGDFYIEGPGGDDWARQFYQPTASAPLPVELSAFNAKLQPDKTVALDWQAQSEVGFSHYGIEHSVDGLNFREIGTMKAEGSLMQAADYHFIHPDPRIGRNYYRLRMVDLDGKFEYSPIRSVDLKGKGRDFSLNPIPTSGPLTLQSTDPDQYAGELRYQLTDNTGKLILSGPVLNEKTDFDLSAYSSGTYYLSLFTPQEQISQFKVLVVRE